MSQYDQSWCASEQNAPAGWTPMGLLQRVVNVALVGVGLAALTLACDSKSGARSTCAMGAISCPCFPDGSCQNPGGQRLECDQGYCVPAGDCTAGSEGCRCYGNGSCDPKDGVLMSCSGNVCVETVIPVAGALNGKCMEGGRCGLHDGAPLSCLGGVCQLEKCRSGEYLCPCALYGHCDAFEGDAILCSEGLCVKPGCAPGKAGCACTSSGTCGAGAECVSGVCRSGTQTLALEAGGARACDVVLELPVAVPVRIDFGAGVRGQFLQRSTAVSLAFTDAVDGDLPAEIAVMAEASSGTRLSASPSVLAVTCFNRLGFKLSEAKVNVD